MYIWAVWQYTCSGSFCCWKLLLITQQDDGRANVTNKKPDAFPHHSIPFHSMPSLHLMIKANEGNILKIIWYQTCVYHTQYKYQSCHNHNISLYTVSLFLPFQFVLHSPHSLCFIINNRLLNSTPFNWSICSTTQKYQNIPMRWVRENSVESSALSQFIDKIELGLTAQHGYSMRAINCCVSFTNCQWFLDYQADANLNFQEPSRQNMNHTIFRVYSYISECATHHTFLIILTTFCKAFPYCHIKMYAVYPNTRIKFCIYSLAYMHNYYSNNDFWLLISRNTQFVVRICNTLLFLSLSLRLPHFVSQLAHTLHYSNVTKTNFHISSSMCSFFSIEFERRLNDIYLFGELLLRLLLYRIFICMVDGSCIRNVRTPRHY